MYSHTFPVRYYEADPMGIVHHSEYIRYFELARDRWLHDNGYGLEVCAQDNVTFPVVHLECDYKFSARYGQDVTASLEVEEFTGARLILRQTVVDDAGHLCAKGKVVLGFLNSATGRVMRCPEKLAVIIEKEINQE